MHDWTSQRMDEIAAFLAVVEEGGFAPGARRLGRDPSVISRRIAALEQRLGVRLLERTTRRVAATEAGLRLADRLRQAVGALAEAEQEAAESGATPQGTLRLALPAAFGRMWIAPLLPEFLAAFPRLKVEASFADRVVDLVAEGYDLAIRVGDLPDSGLVARRLSDHRRLVCASPAYVAARGRPDTPAALRGHDCLSFTRLASYPSWRFRQGGRVEVVRVDGPLRADDAESLVRAALAGHGLVMCSDWLVGPELADGRLVELLPDWAIDDEGAIHLVRSSARFTAAKVRAFADWVLRRLSPPPWRPAVGSRNPDVRAGMVDGDFGSLPAESAFTGGSGAHG